MKAAASLAQIRPNAGRAKMLGMVHLLKEPSIEMRTAGSAGVVRAGGDSDFDDLYMLFRDTDPRPAEATLRELDRVKSDEATKMIAKLMKRPLVPVQRLAAQLLVKRRAKSTFAAFAGFLDSKDAELHGMGLVAADDSKLAGMGADPKMGIWAYRARLARGERDRAADWLLAALPTLQPGVQADPENGALQWKWWTTPRKGEPGIETWPDEYASAHGTGQPWIPGTYDPELNLYIVGTGNPNPVMAEKSRKGDNLYTCSIVAINPDTGKLVWYFQPSPHDTHDWDAVETPILFDGVIGGEKRKLVAQASRNGYFFVLDRATGKRLVGEPFIDTVNWAKGFDAKGQPVPDPKKFPTTDGVLVSPSSNGATNWQAPSFSPDTGLFYVGTSRSYSMYYLTDVDDHPQGWGGLDSGAGSDGNALLAINYQTGKVAWRHEWPSGGGITNNLSTAGNLLFTSNGQNLIAFRASDGKILWHSTLMAAPSAGPISYNLDGKQHLLVAAGDSLYDFTVNQPAR